MSEFSLENNDKNNFINIYQILIADNDIHLINRNNESFDSN